MCFTSLSYHGSMETSSTNLLVPYKLVIFHVLLPGGSVPRHANPGTEAHCVRCVGPHILEDSGARPAARPRHPAPLRRPRVVNIDPKKTGPKKHPGASTGWAPCTSAIWRQEDNWCTWQKTWIQWWLANPHPHLQEIRLVSGWDLFPEDPPLQGLPKLEAEKCGRTQTISSTLNAIGGCCCVCACLFALFYSWGSRSRECWGLSRCCSLILASGFCFTILGPAFHRCRVTSYHCLSCTHLDGRPSILTLQACWYLKNGGILQRPCRLKKTNSYLHVCICIYYARCSLPTLDCRVAWSCGQHYILIQLGLEVCYISICFHTFPPYQPWSG